MTKSISVGKVKIGGGSPVAVQSMTNTKTSDAKATLKQISDLHKAGCDIVRCSVPDEKSAEAMREICKNSPLPIVADIHFDYSLAIKSAEAGASKIRINPGNIGDRSKVERLAGVLSAKKIPIRIGVNAGSLEKEFAEEKSLASAMCKSALSHIKILEEVGFFDIAVSVKSSDVVSTIKAYRLLSDACDYPLHLGVTEAGTYENGLIKSSVGIGALLADGIGDTIRVSLTDDPVKEVYAGRKILRALGLEKDFVEVIACPTCARTEIDVKALAEEVERLTSGIRKPLKVAVMGCVVNGIGEGKHADLGIAGGREKSVLFLRGQKIKTIDNKDIYKELTALIEGELKA